MRCLIAVDVGKRHRQATTKRTLWKRQRNRFPRLIAWSGIAWTRTSRFRSSINCNNTSHSKSSSNNNSNSNISSNTTSTWGLFRSVFNASMIISILLKINTFCFFYMTSFKNLLKNHCSSTKHQQHQQQHQQHQQQQWQRQQQQQEQQYQQQQ